MTRFGKVLCLALLAAEVLWGALLAIGPKTAQQRVFCGQGKAWFLDYQAPREWAVDSRHYHPETKDRWDISCYPPLSYDLVRLFPRETRVGGPIFAAVSALLMALGVFVLARRTFDDCRAASAATALVAFSFPALFVFSTGNPLPLAIGAVCLFFAWQDDPARSRRLFALLALAFAIALKVAPVFFALVLLLERRWRDFLLVGLLAATLTFLPFAWYGGWSAFGDFLVCLQNRAAYYGIRDSWGFVGLDRCLRLGLGLGIESTRATYPISRALNVVFAVTCLACALWRFLNRGDGVSARRGRFVLPLTVALLMLPGGSVIYNSLFLVPALFLDLSGRGGIEASPLAARILRAVAWFLLLAPVQIPFGFSSVNIPCAALALLFLGASTLAVARAPSPSRPPRADRNP